MKRKKNLLLKYAVPYFFLTSVSKTAVEIQIFLSVQSVRRNLKRGHSSSEFHGFAQPKNSIPFISHSLPAFCAQSNRSEGIGFKSAREAKMSNNDRQITPRSSPHQYFCLKSRQVTKVSGGKG